MSSDRPRLLRERVPLAPLTTLGVGGEARLFLEVGDESGLLEALAWARAASVPTFVLGGGSNSLVSDRGFDGLVLRVALGGVRLVDEIGDRAVVEVGAGEPLDALVQLAVARNYAGIECLSGIPGWVGATPIQNVGAYGQEVADTIEVVRTVDSASGEVRVFDNASCGFAYRTSAFKEALDSRSVVTSVTFGLTRGAPPVLRYAELERAVRARVSGEATLTDVRAAVLALRRTKSMVIETADPNHRSAGSFFVNPTVSADAADAVEQAARQHGADPSRPMPRFASAAGVKLSAAWLIEQAGFVKGMADGPVGLSTRHALAIVNRGGATAAQIVAFAARVRHEVRARLAVTLDTEPVRVGFAKDEEAGLRD